MNSIFLFWNIGRIIYQHQDSYDNIIQKLSFYYSYYYGNSLLFTRENLHYMKQFYLNFPIYYRLLDSISWDQYKILLKIPNKKERSFYFHLSILFHSDYQETNDFIMNNYYSRI